MREARRWRSANAPLFICVAGTETVMVLTDSAIGSGKVITKPAGGDRDDQSTLHDVMHLNFGASEKTSGEQPLY
jgi:hypothetical protein